MHRFIDGEDRMQQTLLPHSLEDYVSEENPVRVIEVFIDELDLRQTVEHPYGTIKAWMGSTHFLTRTLKRVSTEMSLHVLAYNLKRMIAIFGAGPLMAAIRT